MPIPCHDIFLGLAVFYASVELLLGWQEFADCPIPIQLWLLISCLWLILFRSAHVLGSVGGSVEPYCFNLFSSGNKRASYLIVGFLFPSFVIWVLVGTLWYAEASRMTECMEYPQQTWYYFLWLVFFYIWIICYTTAIIVSFLVYFRIRSHETGYIRLLEQYDSAEPPGIHFGANGLSPRSIQRFRVFRPTQDSEHACSICQYDLLANELAREMPCGHTYHIACIDGWLMQQSRCPNCKQHLRGIQVHN